jgi:exodeoxyribonuclease VII small subunit
VLFLIDEFNLEATMQDLEKIVTDLEAGRLTLDESLALFERGIKLIRLCNAKLDMAEQKIESLTGKLPEDLG